MNAEIINPFVTASYSVLEMLLGSTPTTGAMSAQKACSTSNDCNVMIGVTGQVHGQVILGMSVATAVKTASTMIGDEIKEFDQLAASAIGELGNMICGNAMQHLQIAGYQCDLTPPTIIRGTNVRVITISVPTIVVPLELEHDEFVMTIGLQEHK